MQGNFATLLLQVQRSDQPDGAPLQLRLRAPVRRRRRRRDCGQRPSPLASLAEPGRHHGDIEGSERAETLLGEVEGQHWSEPPPKPWNTNFWKHWNHELINPGRKIAPHFSEYVSLLNDAAVLNGFNDAAEMAVADYDDGDGNRDSFAEEMDRAWEEIRPLYHHLHAFVRNRLVQRCCISQKRLTNQRLQDLQPPKVSIFFAGTKKLKY